MRRGRAAAWLAFALAAVIGVGAAVAPGAWADDAPSWVRATSGDRVFWPNGDGVDESFDFSYQLDRPANATATVVDAGGTLIATLFESRSECACSASGSWDGETDGGNRAAAGDYRVQVHLEASDGAIADLSWATALEPSLQPRFVLPAEHEEVSGTTRMSVTGLAGAAALQGHWWLRSDSWPYWWGSRDAGELDPTPDALGNWTTSADVTPLGWGPATMLVDLSWDDRLGSRHTVTLTRHVTISVPPTVTMRNPQQVFTPDGDGSDDAADVSYDLAAPATVTTTIRAADADPDAAPLVTLERESSAEQGTHSLSWDGTGPDGQPLPDGDYIADVTAVDGAGAQEAASSEIVLERGPFATVIEPAAGAVVGESFDVHVEPAAGEHIEGAWASISDCAYWSGYCSWGTATPAPDGAITLAVSTLDVPEGRRTLRVGISRRDRFGVARTVYRSVEILVQRPPRWAVDWSYTGAITPDGDGYDDEYRFGLTARIAADASAVVRDHSGTVLRHLADAPVGEYAQFRASWDGRDDDGQLVAPGEYTVEATLTRGEEHDTWSTPVTLTSAAIAEVTAPAAGATLSGDVDVAIAERRELVGHVTGARAYLGSYWWLWTALNRDTDGVWRGTLPTSAGMSADSVVFLLDWTDERGGGHTVLRRQNIQLDVPADPVIPDGAVSTCQQFSPNADGYADECGLNWSVNTDAGRAVVTIRDASDTVVRAVADLSTAETTSGWFTWDGLDESGVPVPTGDYTAHLEYSPPTGAVVRRDAAIALDRSNHAIVRRPIADETYSRTLPIELEPIDSGFATAMAYVERQGGWYASGVLYAPSSDGHWRTTLSLAGLPDATDYTLVVRLDDGWANQRWLRVPFAIDHSRPDVLATVTPSDGVAPFDAVVRLDATDGQGGPLAYDVDWDDGSPHTTGSITEPYAPADLTHRFDAAGTRHVELTVTDADGHSTRRALTVNVAEPPNHAPTLKTTGTALRGVAPFDATLDLQAADEDGDALTWLVDWGDGSDASGDTEGTIHLAHRYARAGSYPIRVEVNDGKRGTVRTFRAAVAPSEPPAARAGDDQTVVDGTPVRLDAGDSRPLGDVTDASWDFGDGETGAGLLVEHRYERPGTYTATLTTTYLGRRYTDAATVQVVADTSPRVDVTVTAAGGGAVGGAEAFAILPDGSRRSATTDASGKARLDAIPDGQQRIYVLADGYIPRAVTAEVVAGRATTAIELTPGQPMDATLETKRMTLDEIKAAGIDPDDAANRIVYEFDVTLAFTEHGTPVRQRIPLYIGDSGTGDDGPAVIWRPDATPCASPCPVGIPGAPGGLSVAVTHVHGATLVNVLVIPVRASFLKEFFAAKLIVKNLSDPGFTLTDVHASLPLPDGLVIAPSADPTPTDVTLPDIPGGEQREVTWLIRGDVEGSYDLEASASAVLSPGDWPLRVVARSKDPVHVWGASAIHTIVEADDKVATGHPYRVRIGLKNISDASVYSARVELLRNARRVGYVEQPREELGRSVDEIRPGSTAWFGPWVLVPGDVNGDLDLRYSSIKQVSGAEPMTFELRGVPREPAAFDDDPEFTATEHRGGVIMSWDAVPGADRYEIYRQRDQQTDFADAPETAHPLPAALTGGRQKVFVQSQGAPLSTRWAVSSVGTLGRRMYHPAVPTTSGSSDDPSVRLQRESLCGDPQPTVSIHIRDSLGIGRWRWRAREQSDGQPGAWHDMPGAPDGKVDVAGFAADPSGIDVEAVSAPEVSGYSGKFSDEPGDTDPTVTRDSLTLDSCSMAALGDSYSSGEGGGDYEDAGGSEGDRCHRSPHAWARQLPSLVTSGSFRLRPLRDEAFLACTGAVRDNITGDYSDKGVDVSQLSRLKAVDPDVVTLTIGGNDAGFGPIVRDCLIAGGVRHLLELNPFPRWSPTELIPACIVPEQVRLSLNEHSFFRDIRSVYCQILDRSGSDAGDCESITRPRRMIVMGYPLIFPWAPITGGMQCPPFVAADVAWMHDAQRRFNERLRDTVAKVPFTSWVDPPANFDGHSACPGSSGGPWLHYVKLPIQESFHPNPTGINEWAKVIADAIPDLPKPKYTQLTTGSQTVASTEVAAPRAALPGRSTAPITRSARLVASNGTDGERVSLLSWTVQRSGGAPQLTLVSPSGRRYTASNPVDGVTVIHGPSYDQFNVDNPEPGRWELEAVVDAGQPGGRLAVTSRQSTAAVNEAPLPLGTADRSIATVGDPIAFDGRASSDSDGRIVSQEWTFGDGATSLDVVSSHTYTQPGTYYPTYTVTDDDGRTATLKLDPIEVRAGGATGSPAETPGPATPGATGAPALGSAGGAGLPASGAAPSGPGSTSPQSGATGGPGSVTPAHAAMFRLDGRNLVLTNVPLKRKRTKTKCPKSVTVSVVAGKRRTSKRLRPERAACRLSGTIKLPSAAAKRGTVKVSVTGRGLKPTKATVRR